jgi:multidrug efflux pump subunit AcrA (membrane-fusion protein)
VEPFHLSEEGILMRRLFALLGSVALLLALTGCDLTGENKPQPKPDKEPPNKVGAPGVPLPASPATHRVEKGPFKIEVALKGTLEAAEMTEVAFKHHGGPSLLGGAGPLTIVKVVEQGTPVKKGDVLLTFDLKKIDQAIRELEAERKIAELTFQVAKEEIPVMKKLLPLDLAAAERAKKQADDDLKRFLEVDRSQSEKAAQFAVKQANNMLENAKEELRHLEKMYKANDLTEETEEIIMKRQRNMVESARFFLEGAEIRRDQVLKVQLPRQEQGLKDNAAKQEMTLKKTKKTLELTTLQKELAFEKQKYDNTKAQERLDNMRKDRDAMTIKAPADGVVYYGKCTKGQWTTASMVAPKLIPGGTVQAEDVLMTIVKPRPLLVRATVEEKDAQYIHTGVKGKAHAVFNPDLKLTAHVNRIASVPTAPGQFEAVLNIDVAKNANALMPGMACTIKLVPYLKKDALAVPAAAVHSDDVDEDKHFVYLSTSAGKHEKRDVTVGRTWGGRVEILSGLEEGDVILLERPGAVKGPGEIKKGAS